MTLNHNVASFSGDKLSGPSWPELRCLTIEPPLRDYLLPCFYFLQQNLIASRGRIWIPENTLFRCKIRDKQICQRAHGILFPRAASTVQARFLPTGITIDRRHNQQNTDEDVIYLGAHANSARGTGIARIGSECVSFKALE